MNGLPPQALPFRIAGQVVLPGTRRYLEVPIPGAYGNIAMSMPVVVAHGRRPGPALLICAAVHGDEIVGTEVVRRILERVRRRRLRGTVVAVPVVNVYGFTQQSRYLPDRRDLNRSFPGSPSGSLAARLAHILMNEVVSHCTHGIDLHTGAVHRQNLPQVRACLDDPETRRLANAFGVPVLLNSDLRDGSLREAMRLHGVYSIVYEAGEALRMDEGSVRAGVRGVLGVLAALGILPKERQRKGTGPLVARSSQWVRAADSGIIHPRVNLGDRVAKGDVLAVITEPTGREEYELIAPFDGIVIGRLNLPLVNEGDAVFHLALYGGAIGRVAERIEDFDANLQQRLDDQGEVATT
jgi:predicted deacylase